VRIQPVDETIADSLNLGTARGALIAGVDEKGPAKPAGLMAGDVIVKFDGKEVKESRDLPRLVASMAVGRQVDVVVIRGGKEVTKTVTLGRLEDGEKKTAALTTEKDDSLKMDAVTKALGMEFSALSDEARKTFKIKDSVKGVIVTSVDPGSGAAERGLRPGDVVEEVNHQAVEHPGDIAKAVEGAKADAKKPVLLLVSNGEGEVRFVAVPVN
jgi:serine protease Do